MRFRDRADAGRRLAALLVSHREESLQVFGLDGGGLHVGYEVARTLGAPLEVWVTRSVETQEPSPRRVGAVSEGGGVYLDVEGLRQVRSPAAELARWMDAEAGEVALTAQRLRGCASRREVGPATAVLVVEGVGLREGRVYAALRGLRRQGPRRLLLAAPVVSAEELEPLRSEADEVVCLRPVWSLVAAAHAYDDFQQVSDLEARQVLARAREALFPAQTLSSGWM